MTKLAQITPTVEPGQIGASEDPREALIPRAPDIDGDLPSGEVPSADVSGSITPPDFSGGFGDIWANIFGGDFWGWLFALGGLGALFGWLWGIYTFLAYLISLVFIVLYIYATIRLEYFSGLIAAGLRDEEKRWNELYNSGSKNSRLQDVIAHAESEQPNDWKLAIIEADIILDQTLKERGYIGDSLGERLRSISSEQLASIGDAWDAHIVRNKIAHEGADFILTKRILDETMVRYRRVFAELGVH